MRATHPTPNTNPRQLFRRPDLRHLVTPRPDGSALTDEIEYDDLVLHRTWRSYEEDSADVRYMMYELSQRDAGEKDFDHFFKAVRWLRVTRVPRYLRQAAADGPSMVFEHQRDLLSALRNQGVLFLNMVAKAPGLPLIFAWGVQASGSTAEEAMAAADESYEVLCGQVEGTYQQLMYQPLNAEEGEAIARYQREWRHIAAGRGRPAINAASAGSSSILDGNRTDVESSHSALDTIIRGMSESSFMLSLVTVPVSPAEMSLAWRNLTKELSTVRSDQSGSRGVSAGLAIPLGLGSSMGDTHGTGHQEGHSAGVGQSDGLTHTEGLSHTDSTSVTDSVSHADSTTHSVSETVGASHTEGASHGTAVSESVSQATSLGHSTSVSDSHGTSLSAGESAGLSEQSGVSESLGTSESLSQSVGTSESLSHSAGTSHAVSGSESIGVSESQSLAASQTQGVNASSTASVGNSASVGASQGVSQSLAHALNQGFSLQQALAEQVNSSETATHTDSVSGSLFGLLGGGQSGAEAGSFGSGESITDTFGSTLGLSETASTGVSVGQNSSLGQSTTLGETVGSSQSVGQTASHGVGTSHTVGTAQSVGTTSATGAAVANSQSTGVSQGVSHSAGLSRSAGVSQATSLTAGQSSAQALGQGVNLTDSVGASQGASVSQSQSVANTQSQSATQGQSVGATNTTGQSNSVGASDAKSVSQAQAQAVSSQQALSDAYSTAMSRSLQTTGTLGVVPNFGINVNRATFDEAKRALGDMLEAQMHRYLEGVNTGAFLYQMFLVCPDRATLARGAGLLKSAFWGPGKSATHQPQPFHVVTDLDDDEAGRLHAHAAAFTSYRRRETRVELVEPWLFSTYMTTGEGAALSAPPLAEATGLLATFDSMPVFAMPADREARDVHLGRLVYGERAKVTETGFGLDVDEITHMLVSGATGMGKTTTLQRFVAEASRTEREVPIVDDRGNVTHKTVHAGALVLDWKRDMRNLAAVIPDQAKRFRFYSLSDPTLGQFRFNLLACPDDTMNPVEWCNTVADLFMVSYGIGEFARSIIWEAINELYMANRLLPFELRPEIRGDDDELIRPAIALPAIDPATLPAGGVTVDHAGNSVANVYSCPALSRLVCLSDLAVLVTARIEELATVEGARLSGTEMRNRLQTVWRRLMYMAPGGPLAELLGGDERLDERRALTVTDLVDPDRGLVTVIEADGIDIANRKLVLGGLVLALWRWGTHRRSGAFDHGGKGPGTFIVLEEAHELFGEQTDDESQETSAARTALWESIFRRARETGLKIVACVQNPGKVPAAITSNTTTILTHRVTDDADRKTVASLMNWLTQVGQQFREYRYLGEMPIGYCIARMNARTSWLESAPVHFLTDRLDLPEITDDQLRRFCAGIR